MRMLIPAIAENKGNYTYKRLTESEVSVAVFIDWKTGLHYNILVIKIMIKIALSDWI